MPLLNDLLDFSDHPLMPPPSAQMFAEHLPAECIQHCLTLSKHATVRLAFGFIRLVFTSDTPGCGFTLFFGTQFQRVDSTMFRTAPDNVAVSRRKPFPTNFAFTAW
ncbi:hypothetical protein NGUA29_03962 [Salmonella enterica]|nr:hypothetical protein NGUA29_03962 [Salmonella enterica]